MDLEDENSGGAGKSFASSLRVIAGVVLFPFLWIGVAVNFLGLAESFSFVPGISHEGGIVSGVVALLLTTVIVGVVVGGIAVATGSDFTGFGRDGEVGTRATPAPTSTPTAAPTPTPQRTVIPTPTAEPTPMPEPRTGLERFEADFRTRLNVTVENQTLTGVPVLATEYRQTDSGKVEMWLVYWECDEADPLREQRLNIGNAYVGTAGSLDGEKPVRLQVYGVTNLKNYDDTLTYINTSKAEATYTREIDPSTYYNNWYDRQHEPTQSESNIAYQMVVNESGKELADKAFKQHHKEVSYCPGGASPGGQSDDSSARISAPDSPGAAEPVAP